MNVSMNNINNSVDWEPLKQLVNANVNSYLTPDYLRRMKKLALGNQETTVRLLIKDQLSLLVESSLYNCCLGDEAWKQDLESTYVATRYESSIDIALWYIMQDNLLFDVREKVSSIYNSLFQTQAQQTQDNPLFLFPLAV